MNIFSSGKIGQMRLKNRVIMASMNVGGLNCTNGMLSKRAIDYFVERAKGGVGMLNVGFVRTTREFEQAPSPYSRNAIIDDKVHVAWMSELAEACHDYNTKVAVQLSPGVGRQAGGYMQSKDLAVGPSELPCFWPPHLKTKELSKQQIDSLVDSFQGAAYHIRTAGVDAISIHGHEGYLLDQFKSEIWNKRNDSYGGSLEGRMRFSLDIIEAIRKGAGKDFPIIYRFSLFHGFDGGRTQEEGMKIASILANAGVDALDIDSGCYEAWYLSHPPSTMPAGHILDYTKMVKEKVNVPVIASGKLGYPEVAESAIRTGKADYISLGRPLLSDPEWVNKLKENRPEDIRPCIGCHEGCLKRIYEHKSISCAVNPAAGNEKNMAVDTIKSPKIVLVIGGGIAGMESARVLSVRGHQVRLFEKEQELGGNFRPQYLPEFKHDYGLYVQYLKNVLTKLKVDVICNHVATQKDVDAYNPDIVIVATGAKFSEIPIKEDKGVKIITVYEALAKKTFNGNYAVLGGGLVGTEVAINIAQKGGKVTLIEKKPIVAEDAFIANRMHLEVLLKNHKVAVLTSTEFKEIASVGLLCDGKDGKEVIVNTENMVFCLGMIPNNEINETNNKSDRVFLRLGDCNRPGKVIDAIWDSYRKARII